MTKKVFITNYLYSNKKISEYLAYIFFFIFFIISILILKDYSISTDEPFHRSIGHYWYIRIIENFFPNYKNLEILKKNFYMMPWSEAISDGQFSHYTILFDILSAFAEDLFKIDNSRDAFYLKHFLTFFCFFISGIFFFKLIFNRFKNKFFSLVITFFYFTSPRIFAESFYNPKDIVFMSFCVYTLYYYFKIIDKFEFKNIIFFSIFAALATDIRVMGIIFLFLFTVFFLLSSLEEESFFKKNYFKYICFILFYFLFVYLCWPILWTSPIENFFYAFKSFSNYGWGESVLYLGKFYKGNNLPWHYISVWIIITLPTFYTILFLCGLVKILHSFTKNFLNISQKNKIWKNLDEQKDFSILFFFITPLVSVIIFNSTLYNAWRHLYFIYPCIIYFLAIGINEILFIKFKVILKKFFFYILLILSFLNVFNLYEYHPYQNVYFNRFISKYSKDFFPVDYWGLGNKETLMFLQKYNDTNQKTLRTASFTPLNYSKLILGKEVDEIIFTGTNDSDQNFIFTNYIYEGNPVYLKKYYISEDYKKIFSLKRKKIVINELFIKN